MLSSSSLAPRIRRTLGANGKSMKPRRFTSLLPSSSSSSFYYSTIMSTTPQTPSSPPPPQSSSSSSLFTRAAMTAVAITTGSMNDDSQGQHGHSLDDDDAFPLLSSPDNDNHSESLSETTTLSLLLTKIKNRQDRFQSLFYTPKPISHLFEKTDGLPPDSLEKTYALYAMTALIVFIIAINIVAIFTLIYGLTMEASQMAIRRAAAQQLRMHVRLAKLHSQPAKLPRSVAGNNVYYHRQPAPPDNRGDNDDQHHGPVNLATYRRTVVSSSTSARRMSRFPALKMDGTTSAYLLSLAISDLLIGLLIAPLQMELFRYDNRWPYGHLTCDLWRALDIFFCTSSAMHTAAIAVDRWWNIVCQDNSPMKTVQLQKTLLIFLWMLSAMVSFPVMYLWQMDTGEDLGDSGKRNEEKCEPVSDSFYILLSTLVSFFLPLTLTIAFYVQIVMLMRRRWMSLLRKTETRFGAIMASMIKINGTSIGRFIPGASIIATVARAVGINPFVSVEQGFYRNDKIEEAAKLSTALKQSRRVIRAMALVVVMYFICWMPLYGTLVVKAVCRCLDIHDFEQLMLMFTWLGYANSGINPLIYILTLEEYRALLSGACQRFFNEVILDGPHHVRKFFTKSVMRCFKSAKKSSKNGQKVAVIVSSRKSTNEVDDGNRPVLKQATTVVAIKQPDGPTNFNNVNKNKPKVDNEEIYCELPLKPHQVGNNNSKRVTAPPTSLPIARVNTANNNNNDDGDDTIWTAAYSKPVNQAPMSEPPMRKSSHNNKKKQQLQQEQANKRNSQRQQRQKQFYSNQALSSSRSSRDDEVMSVQIEEQSSSPADDGDDDETAPIIGSNTTATNNNNNNHQHQMLGSSGVNTAAMMMMNGGNKMNKCYCYGSTYFSAMTSDQIFHQNYAAITNSEVTPYHRPKSCYNLAIAIPPYYDSFGRPINQLATEATI